MRRATQRGCAAGTTLSGRVGRAVDLAARLRSWSMAAACTLPWLLLAPRAVAQSPEAPAARQGAYIALGAQASLDVLDDDKLGSLGTAIGTHLSLRIGQMLTPRFGVGLNLIGTIGRSDEWSTFGGGLVLTGQVLPALAVPLSLHAGIGLGALSLARRDRRDETDDDPGGVFGARYHLAISYDWFPFYREGSGGLALTFVAEAFVLPGQRGSSAGGLFGLELSYWLGQAPSRFAVKRM